MSIKDNLLKLSAFALTNNLSVYNEDGLTAQELNIRNANKIKECLVAVMDIAEEIDLIKAELGLAYNGDAEELELTIGEKITAIKNQVNSSYVCIFNENAMTNLELAGCTARAVNECVKAVNMLADLVKTITISYDATAEELQLLGGGDNDA